MEAAPGIDISGEDTADNVAQVWHVVHVGQRRRDQDVAHALHRQYRAAAGGTVVHGRRRRRCLRPGALRRGNLLRAHRCVLFGRRCRLAGFLRRRRWRRLIVTGCICRRGMHCYLVFYYIEYCNYIFVTYSYLILLRLWPSS
jgi:hypothetical protein